MSTRKKNNLSAGWALVVQGQCEDQRTIEQPAPVYSTGQCSQEGLQVRQLVTMTCIMTASALVTIPMLSDDSECCRGQSQISNNQNVLSRQMTSREQSSCSYVEGLRWQTFRNLAASIHNTHTLCKIPFKYRLSHSV